MKNSEIYQAIFKDNVEEKNNSLVTIEKKGIFNIFKRN